MIVVTAPTGNIGHQVVQNLLAKDEKIRVIARDPSRLPEPIRQLVEVTPGSHADADVLDRAFAGADAVFWMVPPNPLAVSVEAAYLDFTRPALDAFKRHEITHVVGISALGRGTEMAAHAGNVTATLAVDDLIAATGVNYRALTMPSFMENLLRQVGPIREQGVFFTPFAADRPFPTVATRDIATVATRLLLENTWSGSGEVTVLGPENLSFTEMAGIMSDVLAKPVRYQQIAIEAFKANLIGRGLTEGMAQAMVDMYTAKDAGLDDLERRTPEPPTSTSFRQWCEDVLKPAVQG